MRRPVESRGPCLPNEECDGPQAGAAAEENLGQHGAMWRGAGRAAMEQSCRMLVYAWKTMQTQKFTFGSVEKKWGPTGKANRNKEECKGGGEDACL